MGQAMETCCNPTTGSSQDIHLQSFDRQQLSTAPCFRPSSSIKLLDQQIQQTLKNALLHRKQTKPLDSQNLWILELKGEDGSNRDIYCRGNIVDNQIIGEVLIYFAGGQAFRGRIQNRQPVEGVFVFKQGCFYCGQISQFNAEGYGRYQNSHQGYSYDGQWSKSLPYGKGIEVYPNGDIYQGQITYGQKFGNGVYKFSDGKIYQGGFYLNQSDGIGTMDYPNQSRYEGQWKLGKFHGRGKFSWINGQSYEGDYQEGVRHGQGKYIFKNSNWYEGAWHNGLQSGPGVFHQGFDEITGVWKEGQFLN